MIPTPTDNTIPLNRGEFETMAQALDYAAEGVTGLNFHRADGALDSVLSYRALRDRAQALALRLIARFPRNARIAMLAETKPAFFESFYACQYAGLIPVPLPMPVSLGGKDAYMTQVRRMIADCRADLVLASEEFIKVVSEAMDGLAPVETFAQAAGGGGAATDLRPFGPNDACYIQYSSGSTSAPKGVIGTQRSVLANVRAILRDGLAIRPGDRAFCWLPLYHDMGLVGFAFSPMMSQLSTDYLSAADFARRSLVWLRLMSDNRCTIAFSPSFGYELCARRARNLSAKDYDLSAWRAAGIGGDMVRPDVLDQFLDVFGPCGFRPETFLPCYGLAETTLAATFSRLDAPVRTDVIDIVKSAETGRAEPADEATGEERRRAFAACGSPFPGHELEIRGENDEILGDRRIGRVFVRGPSVAPGYFNEIRDLTFTKAEDSWLDTGDMGYWLDGELVITGRSKDLILWNGRNVWPQDIEWAVEEHEQVSAGAAAAFSVQTPDGREQVVTVVECRLRDAEERINLKRELTARIYAVVGVQSAIVLAPIRSLVMTSSGKLARAKVKQKFLEGAYGDPFPNHGEPVRAVAGAR